MPGVIATIPKFQFSANGAPMVGGTLTAYIAGSTTPATTWQDAAMSIANTNPITLDARGECVLWLDPAIVYKFILKNAQGVIQWTQDGISNPAALINALRVELSATGGAAMIGGAGQVVPSIAALRTLLKTSASKNAFVTGYYTAGDGGGAAYCLDVADATTADNAGSVIVAADGGRWKIAAPYALTARQVGAKGDHASNDAAGLQALFAAGRKGFVIPAAQFKFSTGLVVDYRNAFPNPGTPAARMAIAGESMGNTILEYSGAGFALTCYGSDNAGAGQGIHSIDTLGGFTLQDFALAKGNSGIQYLNKAYFRLFDIYTQYLDTGLELQSCFTGKVSNSYFTYGNHGVKLSSSGALGAPNALVLDRVSLSNNAKAGLTGLAVGSAIALRDCTVEQNGTMGDFATGGVIANVGAGGYAGPVTFDSCYFEGNRGLADIAIDNTTANKLIVLVRGCIFNRAGTINYTRHCISATSSGGGLVVVILQGNAFNSLLGYVPDAARPFFAGTAGKVEFVDDGGNSFSETTSLVAPIVGVRSWTGQVSAAGVLLSGTGLYSVSRLSTGLYRVTGSFGKDLNYYTASAMSNDTTGTLLAQRVVQANGSFDVATTTAAGALADCPFSFVIALRGGA